MNFKIKFATVILTLATFPFFAQSKHEPWQQAAFFIEETTRSVLKNRPQASNVFSTGTGSRLTAVWLRLQGEYGISVPWLSSVRLVPQVEVVAEEHE